LNDTLELRVAGRTEEARRLSMRLRALAAELGQVEQRERWRPARVLDGHVQQLIVAAQMRLGLLEKSRLSAGGLAALKEISDTLREAVEATRSLTASSARRSFTRPGSPRRRSFRRNRAPGRGRFACCSPTITRSSVKG
jgi:hypothetical protein